MSKVLQFPLARTRAGTAKTNTAGEVVIFPGVRIERREFNLTDRHALSPHAPSGRDTADHRRG